MRRPLEAISIAAPLASAALLLALALAGCGGSASGNAGSSSSGSGYSTITTKPIPLTSTAFSSGGGIPVQYTCDGANIAPPLQWGAVPPGTHEVVLFALAVGSAGKSTVEWAMGGLNPGLHKVAAGEVPSGAFLVEASDKKRHYSICPAPGQTEVYKFKVYAVPSLIKVTPRVSGPTLLRNLAEGPANFRAPAEGQLLTSYTRS
jgi:phosphatidylethanolamine-binding protein (PEBP) family uncharacterized protein